MGQEKALLLYRGKTFLDHILVAIRVAAIDCAVVAVSRLSDNIIHHCELANNIVIFNNGDFGDGPIGSIRAAVHFLINR
ncbi:MAG: nucleotidyltransferase family protein [Gemmatimonadetes bacterium]|nr:nucleotidyltransferase family protein [Gemmatimonadota bacterium]